MPTPGFTADRSLYRSSRHYRTNGSSPGPAFSMATPQEGLPTCCDAVACKECPANYACAWIGDQASCLPPLHATQTAEPKLLMATGHYPWPYHCTSGDGSAEIYCHTGCIAMPTDAQCLGPGPWGVAEEDTPVYLKS